MNYKGLVEWRRLGKKRRMSRKGLNFYGTGQLKEEVRNGFGKERRQEKIRKGSKFYSSIWRRRQWGLRKK